MSWFRWLGPVLVAAGGIAALAAGHGVGGVLLAGVVLLLVLGRIGRVLVGVLLALMSASLVIVALIDGSSVRVLLLLVAGVAGAVGGALTAATAHTWAPRRSRFERTAAPVDADASSLDVWKAMDAGHDPTAADPDLTAERDTEDGSSGGSLAEAPGRERGPGREKDH